LQERSLALAKELAALKLYVFFYLKLKDAITCEKLLCCCFLFMGIEFCFHILFFRSADMKLQEEEILKLVSLGNHGNLQNAIDVLKRSLAIRNKDAYLLHILIWKQFAHV